MTRCQFHDKRIFRAFGTVFSDSMKDMSTRVAYGEPADQAAAWGLVVRVAGVAAVLSAVVGLALQHFMGVAATPLLLASVGVAVLVGLRLPPAAPAFLQSVDPLDAEIEQLLNDSL
jgi:hypothetical protein